MTVKRLLLGFAGFILLAQIATILLAPAALIIGLLCSGWRPWSITNLGLGPEDPAIRVIEDLGGSCHRMSYFGHFPRLTEPWLQDVPGDLVVEVRICFENNPRLFTDAILAHLSLLKELQVLDLSHAAVTDAGMKELRALSNLRCLNL